MSRSVRGFRPIMIHWIKDNWKNLGGWRTNRKLVVFNVDDYGNVRLASAQARENLHRVGIKLSNRMDLYDALETRQDLEQLFEILDSVCDLNSQPAKFTAYTVPASPDFPSIRSEGKYSYKLLPLTYEGLSHSQPSAYEGAWELWLEGVRKGLIQPQFHGREHLNLTLLNFKLKHHAADLKANLEYESMAGLQSELAGIAFTQAFALTPQQPLDEQLSCHRQVIVSGLNEFEEVFGFRSLTFTPPSQTIHPQLFLELTKLGIQGIDKPYRCYRQLDGETRKREMNKLGMHSDDGYVTIVRNVVFEPADDQGFDPVERALSLMEAAFRWKKPAIISSHRVNFCGLIDSKNRARGLAGLKQLLDSMMERWPEIEFVTADELVKIILDSKK